MLFYTMLFVFQSLIYGSFTKSDCKDTFLLEFKKKKYNFFFKCFFRKINREFVTGTLLSQNRKSSGSRVLIIISHKLGCSVKYSAIQSLKELLGTAKKD